MAPYIEYNKTDDIAGERASHLPEIAWTYEATSSALTRSVLMYRVFSAWNQANRHGFKLHGVLFRGEPLAPSEVAAFNLWIQSGAARDAQHMKHWDAYKIFDGIRTS